jgi:hypothetical protein
MSDRYRPDHDPGEDALFLFGDRIAAGRAPLPHNELEAIALRVQRALGGSARGHPVMPQSLKATIWEDIMQSATRGASLVPANPRRSMPSRHIVARPSPRRLYPRTVWTGAADVVLALLIVLASIATWRTFGGFGSSDDGGLATVPSVVQHSSTPASAAELTPAGSTVATPAQVAGCDLGSDLPIIPDLVEDQSPVETTALYVVQNDRTSADPRGVLKLGCAGEAGVVLAENVVAVWQGPWPGTVGVSILPPGVDDLAAANRGYLNVASGALVTFAATTSERQLRANADGSPWVIGLSVDDPTTLMIADLRTMETRSFAEVTGAAVPAASNLIVSTPADDGTLAVGFAQPFSESSASGTLMTDIDAPGDILLLSASFDDTTWMTVPEPLPRISTISLSPDGSHAAVVSMGEDDDVGQSYRYGVINTGDGSTIGVSAEIPYIDAPFVTWIQNGSAVAYLDGSRVQTLSVDGSGQPKTVFETDNPLFRLRTTRDPNVVVAATYLDLGYGAPANENTKDAVYAVNVATGDIHEFAGSDASAMAGWINDAGVLVMYQKDDTWPETVTYQVFDPVTGDQIGTIADAPAVRVSPRTRPTIGPDSVTVSADGCVEVIALGTQHIYAFTAGAEGLTMRRIASPAGLLTDQFLTAGVYLSPDGSMLSLNGEEDEGRTRYLTSLDDPAATWIEIENNVVSQDPGIIVFAKGTDA